jgi:hypothetical protein
MTDLERLRAVDEKTAGEILGHSVKTLQNWRCARKGPPYMKTSGGRSIRYRISDLLDWQAAGRVDPGAVPRRGRPGR